VLALFAEAAQPVLADERVQAGGRLGGLGIGDVSLRTAGAVGAVAGLEGLAYRAVGGEADLVGLSEEGGEAEVVGGRGVIEDGLGGRFGGGGHGERGDRDQRAWRAIGVDQAIFFKVEEARWGW
jgi:hypothetical protein